MAIVICKSPKCTTEIKNSYRPCVEPTVTHEGFVLATRERNGYHDSDFYAIVWDDDANEPREIWYATTSGWTYHNGATVDATPEIRARYNAWRAQRDAEERARAEEEERKRPVKGKTVRSLTTRGKNVGITGKVVWYGEDRYRSTRWATYYRVGVRVEGEPKLRYIDADRVEVIDA